MPQFRKKPVVISAERFHGGHVPEGMKLIGTDPELPTAVHTENGMKTLIPGVDGWIVTLEGGFHVTPGDWVITGVNGEQYSCKDDIFRKSYEAVDVDGEAALAA